MAEDIFLESGGEGQGDVQETHGSYATDLFPLAGLPKQHAALDTGGAGRLVRESQGMLCSCMV